MREMGMFDTLYDADGNEWQTKAYDCNLDAYRIGDTISADTDATYQVEVIRGMRIHGDYHLLRSLATVREGILASVNDRPDLTLPLLDYYGGPPWPPTARHDAGLPNSGGAA